MPCLRKLYMLHIQVLSSWVTFQIYISKVYLDCIVCHGTYNMNSFFNIRIKWEIKIFFILSITLNQQWYKIFKNIIYYYQTPCYYYKLFNSLCLIVSLMIFYKSPSTTSYFHGIKSVIIKKPTLFIYSIHTLIALWR